MSTNHLLRAAEDPKIDDATHEALTDLRFLVSRGARPDWASYPRATARYRKRFGEHESMPARVTRDTAAAKERKPTKFEMSMLETVALRDDVPRDMLPLFDHLVKLAEHSHRSGYPKRAGVELRQARKHAGA